MDIDPGSVLTNRGLNGFGYGINNQGNFAGDGSAINANVEANRDLGVIQAINRSSSEQFLSDRVTSGDQAIQASINTSNQFLSDRIWSQGIDTKFAAVTAQFASAERLAYANQADTDRQMAANKADTDRQLHSMELKQVECCCELKAGQAAILAKLDADRATAAENEVNNLRMQIQIGNGNRGNSGN